MNNNNNESKIITKTEIDDDKLILDDTDFNENDNDRTEFNIMFKYKLNKHKRNGVHALKQDTIFNNTEKTKEKDGVEPSTLNDNKFNLEIGSLFEFESRHNEIYVNQIDLSNDVYNILLEYTDLDITMNRRKPIKSKFNEYYNLLLNKLHLKYTNSEIFVELSYFFTDNIFNMFKLLDKKYANVIIKELKDKGFLRGIDTINFI
jgi:hypothetical protein